LVWRVQAGAPVKVTGVVDINLAATEAKAKIEKLDALVADEAAFAKAVEDKVIAQDAGVLACLAQAISEHEKGKATGIAGPALRDAALSLVKAKKLADAQAALKTAHAALKGEGQGEAEHPWNKLINMHRMMEEMNYRTSRLRRALRRPRKLQADAGHATVLVVLGLAMEADTHEVKNKEEIPIWNKMSREYSTDMSKLAKAMLEKKADIAKEIFKGSADSCKHCHEKFRNE
jgi:hypothetical protein